ncbi:hypothetical protein [Maricaulis sp.]|uniref:hypothetical protein n=1 Tax=unclassified Maricaulis TaxID=2632371 RepID=UPI001B1450B4|nr:hypothetical protein [Maricaulis sp.]MBO6798387.1 hypothetical protein [Maricaulis sp.]
MSKLITNALWLAAIFAFPILALAWRDGGLDTELIIALVLAVPFGFVVAFVGEHVRSFLERKLPERRDD